MKEKPISIRIPDLEQKFHLKILHHRNKMVNSMFSTTAVILLIAFLVLCFCIYRKNRPVVVPQFPRSDPIQSSITMSSLISSEVETPLESQSTSCETNISNVKPGAPKGKTKLNPSILSNWYAAKYRWFHSNQCVHVNMIKFICIKCLISIKFIRIGKIQLLLFVGV